MPIQKYDLEEEKIPFPIIELSRKSVIYTPVVQEGKGLNGELLTHKKTLQVPMKYLLCDIKLRSFIKYKKNYCSNKRVVEKKKRLKRLTDPTLSKGNRVKKCIFDHFNAIKISYEIWTV